MQMRVALLHDLPAIVRIYNQAVLFTTATFDVEPATTESRRAWFEEHTDRYPLLVTEVVHGGEHRHIAAWGSLTRWSDRRAYDGTVEISVYVDEDYRRQGMGRDLCAQLIERAKSLGYHTIVSRVTADNEASKRLHSTFEFTLIGTMREVGYKFDRYLDVDLYQLMV